jgi:hypothetical protein
MDYVFGFFFYGFQLLWVGTISFCVLLPLAYLAYRPFEYIKERKASNLHAKTMAERRAIFEREWEERQKEKERFKREWEQQEQYREEKEEREHNQQFNHRFESNDSAELVMGFKAGEDYTKEQLRKRYIELMKKYLYWAT